MKKLLGILGLLFGFATIGFAGAPQEQPLPGQLPYSNSTVAVSTASTSSVPNLTVTVAPGTIFNGASVSCRNCFTNFTVQIPTTTVLSVLDLTTGTTFYSINGLGLGSSGVNTLSVPRDHLGPLCGVVGNSTQFNMVNTSGAPGLPQVLNVEGYTVCGTPNQGGVMK